MRKGASTKDPMRASLGPLGFVFKRFLGFWKYTASSAGFCMGFYVHEQWERII